MRSLRIVVGLLAFVSPGFGVADQRLPWSAFPDVVGEALHAFRQTDHWVAEAIAENLDGDRLGRSSGTRLPMNFDPTRQLLFVVQDLNGDGRPEVFLLFDWWPLRGNQQAPGVVMLRDRQGQWRVGCDINDWGRDGTRFGIDILDSRSQGWRDFRTSDGVYTWKTSHDGSGAMECVPASPAPGRGRGRATR
ncbi:MAG: hypothetical protein K2X11_16095 [Acetobacteraceae bacterium]|nr:hypothetical protein [Acetobacteraceae bacterium]